MKQGLKLRKQRSTGDLDKKGNPTKIRSTGSSSSWMSNDSAQSAVTSGSHHTDSNASFVVEVGVYTAECAMVSYIACDCVSAINKSIEGSS